MCPLVPGLRLPGFGSFVGRRRALLLLNCIVLSSLQGRGPASGAEESDDELDGSPSGGLEAQDRERLWSSSMASSSSDDSGEERRAGAGEKQQAAFRAHGVRRTPVVGLHHAPMHLAWPPDG